MHRTIIALITALLLVSAASASFAVYIDDDGPPTDVILATDLVLRASTYTDEIPTSGYTALFSEYESPADIMLIISNGDAWVVESSSSPSIRTALVRAATELDHEVEYATDVPDVLAEREPDTDDDVDVPEDESEENETMGSEGSNETLSDDATEPMDDGSDDFENDSVEDAETDGSGSEPSEERGFWGRVVNALFGWMRR